MTPALPAQAPAVRLGAAEGAIPFVAAMARTNGTFSLRIRCPGVIPLLEVACSHMNVSTMGLAGSKDIRPSNPPGDATMSRRVPERVTHLCPPLRARVQRAGIVISSHSHPFDTGVVMPAVLPKSAVRCLKADGKRTVWLIQRNGQGPRILKLWPLTLWWAAKYALGISAAHRLVRGNRVLGDIGISAPEVLSGPRIVAEGGKFRVEVESNFVPGRDGWQVLRDAASAGSLDSAFLRQAARSIGDIVARLIRHNVFHRDLTIGNFVIDETARVWIVDTDGVRRMRNRIRESERMLGRLAARSVEEGPIIPVGLQRDVLVRAIRPLPREMRRVLLRDLRRQTWVKELLRRNCSV